jgi:hypothetical protein
MSTLESAARHLRVINDSMWHAEPFYTGRDTINEDAYAHLCAVCAMVAHSDGVLSERETAFLFRLFTTVATFEEPLTEKEVTEYLAGYLEEPNPSMARPPYLEAMVEYDLRNRSFRSRKAVAALREAGLAVADQALGAHGNRLARMTAPTRQALMLITREDMAGGAALRRAALAHGV